MSNEKGLLKREEKILTQYKPEDEKILAYFKLLKQYHSLECNILEIGCGIIPDLAICIDEEQQTIGKGSITVYDPELIVGKWGHIRLINQFFDRSVDITSYELIVMIRVSKLNEEIIRRANKHHIDLFVAFCDCHINHSERGALVAHIWQPWMISLAKYTSSHDCHCQVLYLDKKYNDSNPIISINNNHQKKLIPPE